MNLADFDINFIKFSNEEYTFHFKINNTFFTLKENSLFDKGDIDAKLICGKNDSTIHLKLVLDGYVHEICERCLDPIKLNVDTEIDEVLKLTGDPKLIPLENYLSADVQMYNAYDFIYENICLAMPIRKVCENSLKSEECVLKEITPVEDQKTDSRWDKLKNLK